MPAAAPGGNRFGDVLDLVGAELAPSARRDFLRAEAAAWCRESGSRPGPAPTATRARAGPACSLSARAIVSMRATSSRLWVKLSPAKRGWRARGSPSGKAFGSALRAGEQPAPKRRVGDERNAERRAWPRAPLRLPRGRAASIRSAPPRSDAPCGRGGWCRAGLAQAERAHLALLDQPRHGADRVLDRNIGIDAVLIVEIDHIDAEPLEARLAGGRHIFGPAVGIFAVACRRGCRTWSRARCWSRRPAMARPTSCSLWPQPYMSAVSIRVTPRSMAAWISATPASSSLGP